MWDKEFEDKIDSLIKNNERLLSDISEMRSAIVSLAKSVLEMDKKMRKLYFYVYYENCSIYEKYPSIST